MVAYVTYKNVRFVDYSIEDFFCDLFSCKTGIDGSTRFHRAYIASHSPGMMMPFVLLKWNFKAPFGL